MAFNKTNFQTAGGNAKRGVAPQIHTYKTEDAATAIDAANYFADVAKLMSIGDQIHTTIYSDLAGDVVSGFAIHIVNSVGSTTVDTVNAVLSVTSVTDSD